jgi:hypothetical protein
MSANFRQPSFLAVVSMEKAKRYSAFIEFKPMICNVKNSRGDVKKSLFKIPN